MNSFNKKIVLIGAGGHAKVVMACLKLQGKKVAAIVEQKSELWGSTIAGTKVIGGDDCIENYSTTDTVLINAVGSTGDNTIRKRIFKLYSDKGYSFGKVLHPFTYIDDTVSCGDGTQIMAGAIVQPGTIIGDNVIVNTKASIDHDCRIGDHVHIAPGVIISGEAVVGNDVHIGTGATILQGITIGDGSTIGAGSVVTRHVPEKTCVIGIPAKKPIYSNDEKHQ